MARNFNGSSDGIELGTNATFNSSAFTVAAWINPDSSHTGGILGGHASSSVLLRIVADGTVQFLVTQVVQLCATTGTVSNGSWAHVACTYNNPNAITYLNGVQDGTGSNAISLDTSRIYAIGANVAESHYFDGLIAEFAVWHRALTPAEIAILADGYAPSFIRGSGHWYFPLVRGVFNPWAGYTATSVTVTDATTVSPHLRVINPSSPRIGRAAETVIMGLHSVGASMSRIIRPIAYSPDR